VEFWLKQLGASIDRSGNDIHPMANRSDSDAGSSIQSDVEPIQARAGCPKLLIGAQADRGTPALTTGELEAFCSRRRIIGFISTSAKTGQGVEDLIRRMKEVIPWEDKPATVTTVTFKRIKDYVADSEGESGTTPTGR